MMRAGSYRDRGGTAGIYLHAARASGVCRGGRIVREAQDRSGAIEMLMRPSIGGVGRRQSGALQRLRQGELRIQDRHGCATDAVRSGPTREMIHRHLPRLCALYQDSALISHINGSAGRGASAIFGPDAPGTAKFLMRMLFFRSRFTTARSMRTTRCCALLAPPFARSGGAIPYGGRTKAARSGGNSRTSHHHGRRTAGERGLLSSRLPGFSVPDADVSFDDVPGCRRSSTNGPLSSGHVEEA